MKSLCQHAGEAPFCLGDRIELALNVQDDFIRVFKLSHDEDLEVRDYVQDVQLSTIVTEV